MAEDVTKTMETAVKHLRDAVTALEAREAELQAELATVANQRKDAAKALQSLSGEAPRRRRGRPKGPAKPAAVAAAA
jgi:prefoldin subunit 5